MPSVHMKLKVCPAPHQTPSYPKFSLGEDVSCNKIHDIEECENCIVGLRARLSDMDMNNHINNVTYLEWVLDAIPEQEWQVRITIQTPEGVDSLTGTFFLAG